MVYIFSHFEVNGSMVESNLNTLTLTVDADAAILAVYVDGQAPPTCPPGYHWDESLQTCIQNDVPPSGEINPLWILAGLGIVGVVLVASDKK